VIYLKRGHGQFQAFSSKAGILGFQQQGNKKKLANITLAQLRVRYPQYAHLSEDKIKEAIKKDLE